MRIICLGDSITEGIGDEEVKGGWVGRLAEKIATDLTSPDLTVHNLGIAGNTSLDIKNRLYQEVLPRAAEIVVIAAGVNDTARRLWPDDGGPKLSLNFAKEIWTDIVREASRIKNCEFIFLSPLPVNEEKLPIVYMPEDDQDKGNDIKNVDVKAYVQMQRQAVEKAGLIYFDLYEYLENNEAVYSQYIDALPDGLHPNAKGYQLLCDLIYERLTSLPAIQMTLQSS